MYRHLPNSLTVFRLVLAGVFFVLLNQYRYPAGPDWILWISAAIFTLAALTDWLDGHLARRWKVETTFGRIMDPFCDKVLVLGAFIYLSGPRFVDPLKVEASEFPTIVSGVYPWMIAIMLARELLVTGIRDEIEGRGMRFGAKLSGKLKTILQLMAIPAIIVIVALNLQFEPHRWIAVIRDLLVYTTVVVTVISGIPYVSGFGRARRGN